MFMEFQEGSCTLEIALLLETVLRLDFAQLVECLSELAGEPLRVHAESGEGAVGVDDVKFEAGLLGGRAGSAVEQGGFERGNAVDAPRGIGELLAELGFGRSRGLVFVEELAAVLLVGGGVLGGEYRGTAGEAVGEGVLGRTLFAGDGAGAGGAVGGYGLGIWRGGRVCHGGLQFGCGMRGRLI